MSILFWVVEYLATVVEFYLGCRVVEAVVCEEEEGVRIRKRELIFSLGAAVIVIIENQINLFWGWNTVLGIIVYFVGILFIFKRKYRLILLITVIYLAFLSGLDGIVTQVGSVLFAVRPEDTLYFQGMARCLCLILSKFLLFLFVYIFLKYIHIRMKLSMVIVSIITGVVMIVFAFENYILILGAKSKDTELRAVSVAFFGVSLILVLVFLFFGIKLMENSQQKQEIELLELQKEMAMRAERDTGQALEKWRSSIHDYKHKIYALEAWLRQNDMESIRRFVLEENEQIAQQEENVRTGNSSADAIINRKRYLAVDRGIIFDVHALFPKDCVIAEIDLVSILGNLLDNAIEACERQYADNRREMELVIYY